MDLSIDKASNGCIFSISYETKNNVNTMALTR